MKKFILFFTGLILFACTEPVPKPKNPIAEGKMVEILTDIYIHQQSYYINYYQSQHIDVSEINFKILENHGVSPEDFQDNYRYYTLSPDKYKELLKKVRDKLEQKLPEGERKQRINERKIQEKNNKS